MFRKCWTRAFQRQVVFLLALHRSDFLNLQDITVPFRMNGSLAERSNAFVCLSLDKCVVHGQLSRTMSFYEFASLYATFYTNSVATIVNCMFCDHGYILALYTESTVSVLCICAVRCRKSSLIAIVLAALTNCKYICFPIRKKKANRNQKN